MKKVIWFVLVFSLLGNLLSLGLLDRTLFYRSKISAEEAAFLNQGVRIVGLEQLKPGELSPLVVMLGGNLMRYWHLPEVPGIYLYNWGGVEETVAETEAKLSRVLESFSPQMVVINAGFCQIHTAVFAGRDIEKAVSGNLSALRRMVSMAKTHGVVPVLSSLPPVRSRYLLPYTGWLEIPEGKKTTENQALLNYNAEIKRLAESEKLPFIDFHASLTNASGDLKKEYALTDGEHLSAAGYRVLNEFLLQQLVDDKAFDHKSMTMHEEGKK